MKAIFVSVIVPVYNAEKYLDNCLHSLQKQNCDFIEFILIDDSSTDESLAIIDKYISQDNRFQLIRNENNIGAAQSRNKGIARARGEYVGFVDADDEVHPQMFNKLYQMAKKNDCDVSHCGHYLIVGNEKINVRQANGVEHLEGSKFTIEDIPEFLALRTGTLWESIFRVDIHASRVIPDCYLSEDQLWVMDAYLESKGICHTNERLYYHHLRDDSITQSLRKRYVALSNKGAEHINFFIDKARNLESAENRLAVLLSIKFPELHDPLCRDEFYPLYQQLRAKRAQVLELIDLTSKRVSNSSLKELKFEYLVDDFGKCVKLKYWDLARDIFGSFSIASFRKVKFLKVYLKFLFKIQS